MKFDLLIIGGGPAGITLAKELGHKKKVGVIRPEDHSMIYCAMPYVIEKVLPIEKTHKKDALVTDAGAALIRDSVTKVDFERKKVQTVRGDTYEYDKLVIATGATPLLPAVEGRDLAGVMTFKTDDDLRRLLDATEKGLKKAVVVGAGAIGVELAQAFNKVGVETHLVDMEEHILPRMMDYEMVEEAQEHLIASGMHIHLRAQVIALKGRKHVEEVLLSDGNTISFGPIDECSTAEGSSRFQGIVVFAAGMRPNVELFADTGLEIGKDGIIVDERMATNIRDVFAAGDCVQFKSGITEETVSGKLATNAVPMARVLAKNLLGEKAAYQGFFNGVATRIENVYLGGTGLTEKTARDKYDILAGHSELTTIFPIMPEAKKVRMKLIGDKQSGRIFGGQVASGNPVTDKVDLITMAIQHGLTIEDLTRFSYSAQPYQSFFPANSLLVAAAEDMIKKKGL